jgi:hypothetical protein
MHAAPRDDTARGHAGNTRAARSGRRRGVSTPVATDVVRACAHTGPQATAAQRVLHTPLTADCAGAVSIRERFAPKVG